MDPCDLRQIIKVYWTTCAYVHFAWNFPDFAVWAFYNRTDRPRVSARSRRTPDNGRGRLIRNFRKPIILSARSARQPPKFVGTITRIGPQRPNLSGSRIRHNLFWHKIVRNSQKKSPTQRCDSTRYPYVLQRVHKSRLFSLVHTCRTLTLLSGSSQDLESGEDVLSRLRATRQLTRDRVTRRNQCDICDQVERVSVIQAEALFPKQWRTRGSKWVSQTSVLGQKFQSSHNNIGHKSLVVISLQSLQCLLLGSQIGRYCTPHSAFEPDGLVGTLDQTSAPSQDCRDCGLRVPRVNVDFVGTVTGIEGPKSQNLSGPGSGVPSYCRGSCSRTYVEAHR